MTKIYWGIIIVALAIGSFYSEPLGWTIFGLGLLVVGIYEVKGWHRDE